MDEKKLNESDILDFLKERESKTKIEWQKSFEDGYERAVICASILVEIFSITFWRKKEKKEGNKRIPSAKLRRLIRDYPSRFANQEIKDYCSLHTNQGIKNYPLHFSNQNIIEWLKIILHPDFILPDDLGSDILMGIQCSFTLQVIFHTLANNSLENLPIKIILHLNEIHSDLTWKTIELRRKIDEEERLGDQGSKNQTRSDLKKQRLEGLKLHPKYPKLAEAMERYIKTRKGKDKSALNKLLNEMTGVKNQVTIRCYRNDLLEDYVNSKK